MIRPCVEISCSDCGTVFEQTNFPSVMDAHEAVIAAGWEVHPIHGIWIHFCRNCQDHKMEQKSSTAKA